MRIAFVSTMEGTPWGGSEELWSQAAQHLASKNHQVFVSVHGFATIPRQIHALQNAGIHCHFRSKTGVSRAKRFYHALTSSIEWRRQRWERQRWLRRIKPQLVCISDGAISGGLSWMQDCRELNVPYVSVGQANFEGWWPADKAATELREAFSNATRCFFVSQANLELFENQIAMRLPNAEVVRNPFNVPWVTDPHWPELDKTDGLWLLACVARMSPAAKGQDILVNVMKLPHWEDRNIRIDFFGTGAFENGLRSMVDEANVGKKFRFLGQVDDMVNVWESHHALILASRFEGLPLAVVEAMLCNRPVIATSVAGTPEMVEDGVTGFLAKAPTVPLVDEALQRAWAHREQWMQMGQTAGTEARKRIPRAPAELFASKLEQLAKE